MTKSFNVKPAPQPVLLDRFRKALLQHGKEAVRSDATLLAKSDDGRDELFYVPFEHMNCKARLVIVGITPGPNQMDMAYGVAQARLKAGLSDDLVLERAKKEGSFGGDTMRPNLVKMLEYFGIPKLLGVDNANDLSGHLVRRSARNVSRSACGLPQWKTVCRLIPRCIGNQIFSRML